MWYKIAQIQNEIQEFIDFYQQKYNGLFEELINAGDWYDFGGDGTVQSAEKLPGYISLRRVR